MQIFFVLLFGDSKLTFAAADAVGFKLAGLDQLAYCGRAYAEKGGDVVNIKHHSCYRWLRR